jgi:phosphopantetheinyl transferase
MPFISYDSLLPDTAIGLWRIEEPEEFFIERLNLYERELERLNSIKHPQKRLEWLSSRLCLKELLKIDQPVESLNQWNGKPYLSDNSHQISYTHSENYAAVIASSTGAVAIDIEARAKKRNPETRRLFMNPDEKSLYESNPDLLLFLTLWSAKETLYKIVGQKGISLRKDIALDMHSFGGKNNGILSGTVLKDDLEHVYHVYYEICSDFVLTYSNDGLSAIGLWEEFYPTRAEG